MGRDKMNFYFFNTKQSAYPFKIYAKTEKAAKAKFDTFFKNMTWSEKTIKKALENKGFEVLEITLPCKGYERGKDSNHFCATVSKGGKRAEVYLGYKSVKGALFHIDNYVQGYFDNEK